MVQECIRMPTYFLSHGGGPWPYMNGEIRAHHRLMEAALRDIPRQLQQKPAAILVISAHWEAAEFTVTTSARPGMVFDYHGFPRETYAISYPAPGAPCLAHEVQELLEAAGLTCLCDAARGFDHGAFSMLKPMYPEADIPVLQLSLKQGLAPAEHIAMGAALAPLRNKGVLIIGSGMSYHNLRLLNLSGKPAATAFDGWLQRTLIGGAPAETYAALLDWQKAPAAHIAHPREDHLLPLMAVFGAADGDVCDCIYSEPFLGILPISSYRFSAGLPPALFTAA